MNPSKVVERWVLDNATGPYIGGTLVTITAAGLEWTRAGVAEYDIAHPGHHAAIQRPRGGTGDAAPAQRRPHELG